jgi:hypothetical protein
VLYFVRRNTSSSWTRRVSVALRLQTNAFAFLDNLCARVRIERLILKRSG